MGCSNGWTRGCRSSAEKEGAPDKGTINMPAELKVAELDHVVLRCRTIERTLDFYTRVLGLTEERRIAQLGLIQLRAGHGMIDLHSRRASARRRRGECRSLLPRHRSSRSLRLGRRAPAKRSRSDGRTRPALWSTRDGAVALRARSGGERRRAQADAGAGIERSLAHALVFDRRDIRILAFADRGGGFLEDYQTCSNQKLRDSGVVRGNIRRMRSYPAARSLELPRFTKAV